MSASQGDLLIIRNHGDMSKCVLKSVKMTSDFYIVFKCFRTYNFENSYICIKIVHSSFMPNFKMFRARLQMRSTTRGAKLAEKSGSGDRGIGRVQIGRSIGIGKDRQCKLMLYTVEQTDIYLTMCVFMYWSLSLMYSAWPLTSFLFCTC